MKREGARGDINEGNEENERWEDEKEVGINEGLLTMFLAFV